jgi:hypothetical protein
MTATVKRLAYTGVTIAAAALVAGFLRSSSTTRVEAAS